MKLWDHQHKSLESISRLESGNYEVNVKPDVNMSARVLGSTIGILVGQRGVGKKVLCIKAVESPPPNRRFISELGATVFINDEKQMTLPTLVVARNPSQWIDVATKHTSLTVVECSTVEDASKFPPDTIAVVNSRSVSFPSSDTRWFRRVFLYDTCISVEKALHISDTLTYFTWLVHHDHNDINVSTKQKAVQGCSRRKIEDMIGFLTVSISADSVITKIKHTVSKQVCNIHSSLTVKSLRSIIDKNNIACDLHNAGMKTVTRESILCSSRGCVHDRILMDFDSPCPICTGPMDTCIVVPGCNHTFCVKCCVYWWYTQHMKGHSINCPTCRKDLGNINISSYRLVVPKPSIMSHNPDNLNHSVSPHDKVIVEMGLKTKVMRILGHKNVHQFMTDRDVSQHIYEDILYSLKPYHNITIVGSYEWVREIIRQTKNILTTDTTKHLNLKCIMVDN